MLIERNIRQGFFSPSQVAAVQAHLPAALRAVVTVAVYTGWRIQSEILPLQWRQVDQARGVIRLEPGTTKNAEPREFPYTAIPALKATIDTLKRQAKRETVADLRRVSPARPVRSCRGSFTRAGGRSSIGRGTLVSTSANCGGRPVWPRVSGADSARLPPDGGPQPGRRRRARADGDGAHRAQDPEHLRPLPRREGCRP